jgi:hypothetical protein
MLGNTSVTGSMFIFKSQIEKNKPKRICISSNIKAAGQVEQVQLAALHDRQDNADMIVITHRDLLESANAYKDYRSNHDGMNVIVVTTDEIFTEFGSCIPDPTAIRDYLAWAYNSWTVKPKYVLLWGDGHYDYKDITHSGKPNYVPPFETEDNDTSFDELESYSTDDYFANISDNDDRVDVAIGRLPIGSPSEGMKILEKIKRYEGSPSPDSWRSIVTFVADDGIKSNLKDTDSSTHTDNSEYLSRKIPDCIQQKKIYLAEYPTENITGGRRKPGATNDLVTIVNTSGTLLINWIGHGSPRIWAHEEVLDRDKTIPRFTNNDKLFFTIAATCDFGRFDMTNASCGSEELVMYEHGGAIASLAATRVVNSSYNQITNSAFIQALFKPDTLLKRYPTLGEALLSMKREVDPGCHDRFNLLGDPSISLKIPEETVAIDSINGIAVHDTTIVKIKARSAVIVRGRILDSYGSRQKDESFNGTIVLNVFDSDRHLSVKDENNTPYNFTKTGSSLNKSSFAVRKGEFQAEFVVPTDVSFTGAKGRIYAYAYSPDEKFAKGSSRSFIIEGIDTSACDDVEGPVISVFLDSRYFLPCQVVSSNPLLIVDLKDTTGIIQLALALATGLKPGLTTIPIQLI